VDLRAWVLHPDSSGVACEGFLVSPAGLAAEAQGIYAGLVMLESKCMGIHTQHQTTLSPDVIPFLQQIPSSTLERLRLGLVNPGRTIRNALEHFHMTKDAVQASTTVPRGTSADPAGDAPAEVTSKAAPEANATTTEPQISAKIDAPTLEECLYAFFLARRVDDKTAKPPNCKKFVTLKTEAIAIGHGLNNAIKHRAAKEAEANDESDERWKERMDLAMEIRSTLKEYSSSLPQLIPHGLFAKSFQVPN
jgi:hypothetical protein